MYPSAASNVGRFYGLGIQSRLNALSALFFVTILSACGGSSGGSDLPGPSVSGAPTLSETSIASGDLTTVTVGDTVTVSISASEAILSPSVLIGGSAVDRVVGSGTNWTADRVMLAGDTPGDITVSVAFKDIGGEAGTTVEATSDGSALTLEINTESGAVVDGPFEAARVFADYNGNGLLDVGEPSDLTDANGEYDLVKTTDARGSYNIVVEMTADTKDSISGESYANSPIKLKAPSGGNVVSPLTTILVAAQAADSTVNAADLADAMGLSGVDIENYNPFAPGMVAADAHKVEKVFQQVMTAALVVSEAMEGVASITGSTLSAEDSGAAALLAVTKMITEATDPVDFSDSVQIAALKSAAKDELTAAGVIDESSSDIADYMLDNAAGTVSQISTAIQALDVSDFGQADASVVSALKHDASLQVKALALEVDQFLDEGATDLTQLDISEIITLADADGVATAALANLVIVDAYLDTLGGRVLEWGAFGGVGIADGGVFTHPSSAEAWGGFYSATTVAPLSFSVGGTVTFNAALQAGSNPVGIVFQFEEVGGGNAAYNFKTEAIVVNSETEETYTAMLPAQDPSLTYESLILFLEGLDSPVQICNVQFSNGIKVVEGIPCATGDGDAVGDDGDVTLEAGNNIDFNDAVDVLDIVFVDFGDSVTTVFGQDPEDATRNVAITTKGTGAQEWAGTTIDAGPVIFPVTATATTMTLRVYSPDDGLVVRLKLEESGDPTRSIETDAVTTVANQWEILKFDFSDEAYNGTEPTAALNTTYVFDKISVFFNKGTTGDAAGELDFYWDSLTWVGEGEAQPTSLKLTVTAADASAVRLTGPWWGWDPAGGPEAADNGDGTWTVTFAEAPAEAMEYLWVADGVQENLIASSVAAECADLIDTVPTRFNTDYNGYANRKWQVGTGDFTDNAYGTCVAP